MLMEKGREEEEEEEDGPFSVWPGGQDTATLSGISRLDQLNHTHGRRLAMQRHSAEDTRTYTASVLVTAMRWSWDHETVSTSRE